MASVGPWLWRCQAFHGSPWLFLGVLCPLHQLPFSRVLSNVFCAPSSWGQVQGQLFRLVHLRLITPRTFCIPFSETNCSSDPEWGVLPIMLPQGMAEVQEVIFLFFFAGDCVPSYRDKTLMSFGVWCMCYKLLNHCHFGTGFFGVFLLLFFKSVFYRRRRN